VRSLHRRQGVFVDRDGVLNQAYVRDGKPASPRSVDELTILPRVASACEQLHGAGYLVVVVTNQPDIARGRVLTDEVAAMHAMLRREVPVDAVYLCPHDDADGCSCRKPAPGLLVEAARDLGIELSSSFMVGDRWSDIEAGHRAGCRTVHVERGYWGEPQPIGADHTVTGLPEAAEWIIGASAAPVRDGLEQDEPRVG